MDNKRWKLFKSLKKSVIAKYIHVGLITETIEYEIYLIIFPHKCPIATFIHFDTIIHNIIHNIIEQSFRCFITYR